MSTHFASLGSVADFINGAAFKPEDWGDDGKPIVRIQNLTDPAKPFNRTKRHVAQKLHVNPGDLLVSWSATLGVFEWLGSEVAVLNQHIFRVVPDPARVEKRYLRHGLELALLEMQRHLHGATMQHVNRREFLATELYLPSLPEQRRIAETLDKVDALRSKRRAALAQLDTLSQSNFLDMFGDPVTNPKGWPESTPLGDVADVVSGVTIGRRLEGKRTRAVPYLAVVNVQDRRLDLSVAKSTEATEDEIVRYRLKRNDLLLTEGGDPDKLGRGTLWNDELAECIHQNHVFRVRLECEDLTPLFLNWLVGSQRGKGYFLRAAKQTTGIASINMTQLRAFPLLLPPVQLQRQFGSEVARVDTLKAIQRASLDEMDALFGSLQHRAFRGEL